MINPGTRCVQMYTQQDFLILIRRSFRYQRAIMVQLLLHVCRMAVGHWANPSCYYSPCLTKSWMKIERVEISNDTKKEPLRLPAIRPQHPLSQARYLLPLVLPPLGRPRPPLPAGHRPSPSEVQRTQWQSPQGQHRQRPPCMPQEGCGLVEKQWTPEAPCPMLRQ